MSISKTARQSKRLQRLLCSVFQRDDDLDTYVEGLKGLVNELDEDLIDHECRLFKALANETRLKMIRLLTHREMCVCELMVALELTQPTASHHLNILESARLVKDRKKGRWVFYSIANPELFEGIHKLNIL